MNRRLPPRHSEVPHRDQEIRPMTRREALEDAVRTLAPRIPGHEFEAVVDHALVSPGLRGALPERGAWLSMVAYIRHRFTDYDSLLDEGYDQDSARFFVLDEINATLEQWGSARRVSGEEEAGGER
jgi:hypothetical protein